MFMAMKWGVAFPLVLVAWGFFVIAMLELFIDRDPGIYPWVGIGGALSLAFVALVVGYLLRRQAVDG